jgi:hypothetical protein
MKSPCFHIFRHQNKVLVDQFMENHKKDLDPNKDLANQQSISPKYLKVMKFLARSRETADRSGMGFYGSFVTDDGYHYSITNIDSHIVEQKMIDYLINFRLTEDFDLSDFMNRLRVIQTSEGVKMELTDEQT